LVHLGLAALVQQAEGLAIWGFGRRLGSLWMSQALGVLALAPLLLVTVTPWLVRRGLPLDPARRLRPDRTLAERRHWGDWFELTWLTVGTSVLGLVLAVAYEHGEITSWHLWGLPLLFIVWASLRQGIQGGMTVVAASACLCLLVSPWTRPTGVSVLALQGNLLAQCITALLVGASISWIRANEARYRRVVGHIPVVLYSARIQWEATGDNSSQAEITFVSPASRPVLGCEPEALQGEFQHWLNCIHPEDRELMVAAIAQLRLDPKPLTCEYRVGSGDWEVENSQVNPARSIPRQELRAKWVRDTLVPHVSTDGRLEGWEGVVEDITEQRALAHDLRRTTSMFHALVSNLPAGVFFVQGPSGQPILVNARARQLLGQREDLAAGLPHLSQVYHLHRPDGTPYPSDELPVAVALRRGLTSMRDDIVVHRPDGRRIPLVTWAAPIDLGGKDNPDAAVWVFEDLTALHQAVTAHRHALEVLRVSEEKYRGLVESLPLMLLQADRAGHLVYMNPTAQAVTGYDAAELHDTEAWKTLVHPDDLARVLDIQAETLAGRTGRLEIRLRAKDGATKVCFAIYQPRTHDGDVTGLTILAVDMTHQRHLEQELQRAHQLGQVGRLASGIAHDFNNLLTVVLTLADLAQHHLPADHPARDDLRRIGEAGEQATRLAGQLLSVSKQRRPAARKVNINEVVAETLDLLRSTLPPNIVVEADADGADLLVEADDTQLRQVLINLCLNARDAMPHGGRLTVQTAGQHNGEGGPHEPDGWVRVSVLDTGQGMEADVRGQIFNAFFSTKTNGTGIGLAVVQQIVDSLGGRIEVWSQPAHGTRFDVWLPRAAVDRNGAALDEPCPLQAS
jgi:PAS domain S-box-containing protein